MALAGWRGIDTQKPASLSAYGLDSATPPRVYTFSAEPRSLYTFKPPRAPKRGNSGGHYNTGSADTSSGGPL